MTHVSLLQYSGTCFCLSLRSWTTSIFEGLNDSDCMLFWSLEGSDFGFSLRGP